VARFLFFLYDAFFNRLKARFVFLAFLILLFAEVSLPFSWGLVAVPPRAK